MESGKRAQDARPHSILSGSHRLVMGSVALSHGDLHGIFGCSLSHSCEFCAIPPDASPSLLNECVGKIFRGLHTGSFRSGTFILLQVDLALYALTV